MGQSLAMSEASDSTVDQAPDPAPDEPSEATADERPALRNPFRSESDAFRLLVIIGVAIAVMIAAVKLGGPWVGIPVVVLVFGAGIRATFRWLRLAVADREAEGPQPF